MRAFDYQTVDVFSAHRFGGNPLAVFPDARGLQDAEMQAIAREFNYSESTFVLPPADPLHTARVRIFTPTNEVPFAGHPNVGTAFVLGRLAAGRGAPVETMRFEEDAGLVDIHLLAEAGSVTGARIRAPRALELGAEIDPETIAACTSLDRDDVRLTHHRPVFASVGLWFAVAELRSVECLAEIRTRPSAFAEARDRYRAGPVERFSLFVYARTGSGPERLRARMFAPLSNIPEDPATGSASAALAGLLASMDPRADADLAFTIDQGVEMGRPSHLDLTAVRRGGAVVRIDVAGRCAQVMAGRLLLDG